MLFPITAVASADVLLVVLSRRLAGRPLLRSGPDHLAHRLRRLGLTPQGATVLPGIGAFAGVLVGVLMHIGWTAQSGVFWVAAGALVVVLLLLRVPVYVRRPVPTQAGGALSTQTGRAPSTQAGRPVSTQVRSVSPQAGRPVSSQVSGHLRVRNG